VLVFLYLIKFRRLSHSVGKLFYDKYLSKARCYFATPIPIELLVSDSVSN
jgi:hypothetical protein